MRFDLTVSDQRFEEKLPKGSPMYSKITFTQRNVSIQEFAELILQGHLFSGVYSKQHFHIKDKTIKNFERCNAIAIDIDDSDCPMDDYIQTLTYKPTIAYETFGNLKDGNGYRYRFVYVFEDSIYGRDTFTAMYNAVCNANNIDIDANDTSMQSCNQMFYGTAVANDLIIFGNAYHTDDFNPYIVMDDESVQLQSLIYKQQPLHNNALKLDSNQTFNFNDESFGNAWQCKTDIEVLMDMRHYQTSECTQIEWNDGELWHNLDNENYYEIKRKWEMKLTFNGGRYKRIPTNRRLNNGKHRRKKIFLSLMRRRLIDPTITFEHLCYAALYELYFFIDNTDLKDYITRQQLKEMAGSAMNTDLERYSEKLKENKKYKINKMERIKRGLTPAQAVAMANTARRKEAKEKRYKELEKKYDPNKSVRENAEILGVSNGTVQSLKKWKNEQHKANDYPKVEEETNMDICCEDMIRDIYRIIKKTFEPDIIMPDKKDLSWMKNFPKNFG